ncbi:hypothetical protein DYH10_01610 [Candidatus Saccharibacteria bacterium CPR2]|nr:hypothetical protein [Candidatus Saccharibacteria bacterium CPR2]
MSHNNKPRSKSALTYVLSALIPYTEANLKLAFVPSKFFYDLEKISKRKSKTIKNSYYQAIKRGLVELDREGIPRLTNKGLQKAKIYKPKLLKENVCLMVTFDIPESERWKRRRFRAVLREFRFSQAQKSVWISKYDFRTLLLSEIKELGLEDYIDVYEAHKLDIYKK